ncbi:hypothetical protein EDC04DRAFT_2914564 [Pisolithus marmoratus]|nr:hypothetical protein EDC04DRAFT_2914564 [Pisolithus marmoratus]
MRRVISAVKDCPRPFKFSKNLRTHILKAGSRWDGPGVKGDPSMQQVDLTHEERLAPGAEVGHASDTIPGTGAVAGPSRAKMDPTHDKGFMPGAGTGVHAIDTVSSLLDQKNKQLVAYSAHHKPPEQEWELGHESESKSDTDQSSEHSTGSSTSEDLPPPNPMLPQDEIMCSPTPTKPSTQWSNMNAQEDVDMGSPMSDKSVPPQQLPLPLPSLLSVMQSQSASTSQLPSTSTTTTPASHAIGLLHHAYLDSLNLAAALATGEVKHHLTKMHGSQSRYNEYQFKQAISALKVATELPSHITGPRSMVRRMAMSTSFKTPSHHAKA